MENNKFIPKTETRLVVEDLYPELGYHDIRETVGYGPMAKWCYHCSNSKNVSDSTNYCPSCGNAFGAKTKAQEQHERNKEVEKQKGGMANYRHSKDKDGNNVETATYVDERTLSKCMSIALMEGTIDWDVALDYTLKRMERKKMNRHDK